MKKLIPLIAFLLFGNVLTARESVVKLTDDSILKGNIETNEIILNTKYGKLIFPLNEIIKINVSPSLNENEKKIAAEALINLVNPNFKDRNDADKTLRGLGISVYNLLKNIKPSSAEDLQRIDKILRVINPHGTKVQEEDLIHSKVFLAKGQIETKLIVLNHKLLGKINLDITRISNISFMQESDVKLTYKDHSQEWLNTNVYITEHNVFRVNTSGLIDCWPNEPNEWVTTPNGPKRWSGNCGKVYGKIGESGAEFFVGEQYQSLYNNNGFLFLRIHQSSFEKNNGGFPVGSYTCKILVE